MSELLIHPDTLTPDETENAVIAAAVRRPYAPPEVASFALDPLGVGTGDALTANG